MYQRRVYILILLATVVRMIIAATTNLGNDEVYYLLYARYPDYNYFDHPPLVGWAIRFCTLNLGLQHELFYRLPAILGSAVGTWLMYRIGTLIHSQQVGWYAAFLYTASIYASVIAGLFILPDSVQLVCWLAALYYLLLLFCASPAPGPARWYWLAVGFFAGLAIFSKVHGIFFWLGLGAFCLFHRRDVFRNPFAWLAFFLSLLFLVPVWLWNAAHDFITYRYHGDRVSFLGSIDLAGLLREWAGEIAYHNPVNWVLILITVWRIRRIPVAQEIRALFLWLSLPIIFVLWGLAVFRDTLPHWSGPGYTTLIPLAALMVATEGGWKEKFLRWALRLTGFVLILAWLLIMLYPGTIGKQEEERLGKGDFTLDMYGWKKSGRQIGDYLRGKGYDRLPMISPQWFPAAHLDEYLTRPLGMRLYLAGPLNLAHHYEWFNAERGGIPEVDSFLYVCPSNMFRDPVQLYGEYFDQIRQDTLFTELRSGRPTRHYRLYLLYGRKQRIPEPSRFPPWK